ncbi:MULTISPECIES: transporter substrate-binding domain-containing protein [unclassified Campylobacter]|uniref:transporter substrate-binding domain-containing protein n=1 Tax=unclassified Campylobacter TaxID=2593542 RepID=UPI0022E9BC87|nr:MULTISPECIES: transporter substrate-binding domain-containing protein [unclassified Campylobacter]MDA3043835.1 transporter substrate-binding domain-containing protein [Campylobacter sp. JMF_09 ED2]MDA3043984.1 transporter substrate-binding domain-containing protein [Campylobacter sp. JMF_07 ED4]MDA3064081.1 transporter substrate-binding domain-containing protein [Campylobacter sp. JMF_11 EL3]MDA3072319.1 transporter substrate-binding domain-containing protein [Campylobacter sp. VBCF_03 NA9]
MKKFLLALAVLATSAFSYSLDEIRARGEIRIGVYDAEPPFGELVNGKFEGFEVELAEILAKRIFGEKQGHISLMGVTNDVRFPLLQENKVDMIVAAVSVTPERAHLADFTAPYFTVNLGLLTRKGSDIKSVLDLKGKKIGALLKTTGEAFLNKEGIPITYCNDSVDCYKKVKNGELDGYVNNNLFVYAYPIFDPTMEVKLSNLGNTVFLSIAIQKGNTSLLEFLNEQIIALSKEGFFTKAYNETFEPFYKGTIDKKYFLLDNVYKSFF